VCAMRAGRGDSHPRDGSANISADLGMPKGERMPSGMHIGMPLGMPVGLSRDMLVGMPMGDE
jgi:hypothetical protein